jgi:uncharacterized protein
MSLFLLRCLDKEGSAEARAEARDQHLAHVRMGNRTRLAGPLLDPYGKVAGSMLVIEARDLEDARGFSAADPLHIRGIYRDIEIHPMKLTYIALETQAGSMKRES